MAAAGEATESAPVAWREPPPVRAVERRRAGWRGALAVATFAGLGGVAGFFGARMGFELFLATPEAWQRWALLPLVPLVWWCVVGVHECGHVLGGWAIGGRFLLWSVGPGIVQRTPQGLRVGWNRSLNLFGGVAACLPLDVARVTPRRVAMMVSAGPLASLALVPGALWFAAWLTGLPGPVGVGRALAQNCALTAAALSGFVFLVALWPSSGAGFKSDGRRVWELLRGDDRSDQEAALLTLTTLSLAGVRPADYEPELVRRALALNDSSLFDLYGRLTIYYHAADLGDWRRAQSLLDVLVDHEDHMWQEVRSLVRCEYAWLLATAGGPAAARTARAWLETAGPVRLDPATPHRARAAVSLAEGRYAEAAQEARAGLAALERASVGPVRNAFAAEALERVLAEAQRRAAEGGAVG